MHPFLHGVLRYFNLKIRYPKHLIFFIFADYYLYKRLYSHLESIFHNKGIKKEKIINVLLQGTMPKTLG